MTYQNSSTPLAKVDRDLNEIKTFPSGNSNLPPTKKSESKPLAKGFGLRVKTILTAIALGVIPLTTIGAISYKVTQNYLSEQIDRTQESRAEHLSGMLEKYLVNRVHESEVMANSPIFTNPNLIEMVTVDQKKAALNNFKDKTGFYDSIVYLDVEGNPLFQSQSERPLKKNYSEQKYFQEAITSKMPTINQLGISSYTGEPRIEFAIPIKNAWTDEVIGVLRFRIPSQNILPLFENYVNSDEQWYVINTQGMFFANTWNNLDNQPLANYFPQLQQAHAAKKIVTEIVNNPRDNNREQIINYVPVRLGTLNSGLNIGTALALDRDVAFTPLKYLKWIYVGGTIGTILLIGTIAGFLANQIVKPLLKLTAAVNELSQGKLNTRISLNREDELGVLGNGINDMAVQLEESMQNQSILTRTSELMARISQSRNSRELQLPFSLFLAEVRNFIKSDRVIFYQLDSQSWGTVVAESVAADFPRTLGVQFDDPCFAKEYIEKYQRGRIQAVSNIYEANLTSCHLQQLEPYEVKASLVLPVVLEYSLTDQPEKLAGLLIAHQCSGTRIWTQSDIDYLQQTAYQLAIVLRGYITAREESLQKASVQKDLNYISSQLANVTRGDLTLEANYQTDSSSKLVQSFNNNLHNLRQIVRDIKSPSQQLDRQLALNNKNLATMNDGLHKQSNQLALFFAFVEQTSDSAVEVSSQIEMASNTIDSVVTDLESEKVSFEQAISFVSELETDLRSNQDRVKNLGIASGKMTKVINSIRKINLRASLLTSKLGKRIPELDESAYGLKEEIKSIQQSIAATKELENIVIGIDREIKDVLQEYQKSENQLKRESCFAIDANHKLEQIVKMTKNAHQKLFSSVNILKMQQQTYQKIDRLQKELNETTESLAHLSTRTTKSLSETSVTAKDLENIINFFQLERKI